MQRTRVESQETQNSIEKSLQQLRSELESASGDNKRLIEREILIKEDLLRILNTSNKIARAYSGHSQATTPHRSAPITAQPGISRHPLRQSTDQRQEALSDTGLAAKNLNDDGAAFEREANSLKIFYENYFTNSLVSFFKCCCCCCLESDEENALTKGSSSQSRTYS